MLTLQLLFPLALLTCYWLAGCMERLTSGAGGTGSRRFLSLGYGE